MTRNGDLKRKSWREVFGVRANEQIFYMDKSFCPYWNNCQTGHNCKAALTEDVIKEAAKFRLPVQQMSQVPLYCYKHTEAKV